MWSRYVMSQVKHNSYFITGMVLGLWVSVAVIPLDEEAASVACVPAGPAGPAGPAAALDEFEPRHEERPPAPRAAPAPRSLQRPRYYTTELGMRGSLLAGVLTSEEELSVQVPALNRTLALLLPALKFFTTARAPHAPALPNVVGFTDTREMLKPFHALKYLADNFLEEYDFFFLVSDGTFVNARRLTRLAARLSVGRDLYMGEPAADDSQYCSLEGGILLSNSVLRAVHAELEWCVRNSYSPHHHENIGRCVLHAAHAPCVGAAQGRRYRALRLEEGAGAAAALADAVTARPARGAELARLHALAARQRLQRDRGERARAAALMRRSAARHPPHYRNGSWPAGLRADPGLAPPPPEDRHSHARWTAFNATHALMPDETRAAAPLAPAQAAALRLVADACAAWARRRWPAARAVTVAEGAWRWEPAQALRYRLTLRLEGEGAALRQVEAVRALGAARLVPVPYVTESARVTLVLGVAARAAEEARGFLARFERAEDANVRLVVVAEGAGDAALRAAAARLPAVEYVAGPAGAEGAAGPEPEGAAGARAGGAALVAAAARVPRDTLLLLVPPHLEFNQDFLNRVRMNTIAGRQWFSPLPFARHSQYAHPRFLAAGGGKPAVHTGRFRRGPAPLLAAYAGDVAAALAAWRGAPWDAAGALAAAPLRCVRAPEPGAVLLPRGPPCAPGAGPACGAAAARAGPAALELGARGTLAALLLELRAEAEA